MVCSHLPESRLIAFIKTELVPFHSILFSAGVFSQVTMLSWHPVIYVKCLLGIHDTHARRDMTDDNLKALKLMKLLNKDEKRVMEQV